MTATTGYLKHLFWLLFLVPILSPAQKKQVTIRIGQDQSVLLDAYESHIVLEKKSFKIQVMLENVDGIYVFAAFSDSVCCRLSELDSIPDFMNLPDKKMKEPDYNKDKELLVNDENSCSYWFYQKGKPWTGFNKKVIELDTIHIVAIKTVKQLFYVPHQKEIKVKDVDQPLYLLFVAVDETDQQGHPLKELIRKKVRIDWIEER